MNPAQAPAQGQQQGQQAAAPQQRPPMYQPAQIRNLPHLTDDEKRKYEAGLRSLWTRANNSPQNSPENIAARQKIIEFSKMLITKIQARRTGLQQQQQQQLQAGQGQQSAQGQQQPAAQAAPQPASQPQQNQQNQQPQQQAQQPAQPQPQPQAQAMNRPPSAQQSAPAQAPAQAAPTPQQQTPMGATGASQQAGQVALGQAQANPNAAAAAAAAAQAQKPKISDQLLQHVNKMVFRPPLHIAEKSTAEAAKWIEEMRERYARALMTMESSKKRLASMEQSFNERKQQGNPVRDDELRAFQVRKEQQLKLYAEAHKWMDGIRKQQGNLQGAGQASQNAAAAAAATAAAPAAQQTDNTQAAGNAQANTPNNPAAAVLNAAQEAARNHAINQATMQHAANRASPANGVSTPIQPPTRPTPSVSQPAAQPTQAQPQVQPQISGPVQTQPQQQQQPHPPTVNTALAANTAMQNQASGTPTGARVQTPQSATAATAAGPTRALSHSAALSLANQRAATTPGGAPVQGQQASGGTSTPTGGAMTQGIMAPGVQHQQGHPHAHPTQSQQTIQSKMPIPKHLPERATSVPQGVTVGGGVNTGRPTMSQGGGTLGGVMNQPAVPRIPAYSHEAEGDHVLSKKKLDELVRQVCGGAAEGQEGNLLTPEVEENVLNMADSFVDNVLHAACRNAKERGSKVLEIRDIQLILERTYNIRIPGYSSDELRTVRKVLPSSGWIAKMSAVQAAKVMPGKTD